MDRIAAQRARRRQRDARNQVQVDPPSIPSSPTHPTATLGDDINEFDREDQGALPQDASSTLDKQPTVMQHQRRRILFSDEEDNNLEREEREEEEESANRHAAEGLEQALVAEKTRRKVILTVTQPNATDRSLLPARQQV
jgi:hypothetical protein